MDKSKEARHDPTLCAICQRMATVEMQKNKTKVYACPKHWVELMGKGWRALKQFRYASN